MDAKTASVGEIRFCPSCVAGFGGLLESKAWKSFLVPPVCSWKRLAGVDRIATSSPLEEGLPWPGRAICGLCEPLPPWLSSTWVSQLQLSPCQMMMDFGVSISSTTNKVADHSYSRAVSERPGSSVK